MIVNILVYNMRIIVNNIKCILKNFQEYILGDVTIYRMTNT